MNSGLLKEYGAVLTLAIWGEKFPSHFCPCSKFKSNKSLYSSIYEHKELNNKITLHLLKTHYVSNAFSIQYLLSLPKSQKANVGIFSLQRRTLRFRESYYLAQSHTAIRFQSKDLCTTCSCLNPEPNFFSYYILPPYKHSL